MGKLKKGAMAAPEELNLIPIMNMVVCLIPMILAGTALVKLGVINVNAPKFGMGAATEATDDQEKPLNLTVAIANEGFRLSATGADINVVLGIEAVVDPAAAEGAAPVGVVTIAKRGEDYDYMELYNKLVKIKSQFPQETILNLTADPTMPFKHVVNVIDAVRLKLEQDTFAELEQFTKSPARIEDGVPALLWPDVVFAVAQ